MRADPGDASPLADATDMTSEIDAMGDADRDALLARWLAQGGSCRDPVRVHYIAALRRRAAQAQGPLRDALDARVVALLRTCAQELAQPDMPRRASSAGRDRAVDPPHPLASVVDALAQHARMRAGAAQDAGPMSSFPTALPALEPARRQWADVRSHSRLQAAMAPPPEDAGPLNSTHLVHRAFATMRAAAPGYLLHFLDYVDALSGLERLPGLGDGSTDAGRVAEGRKRGRAAPRKRRG
ncbi:DUF2894 domain-containing protein [Luteimonas abyssi]|uniref:DUF2894 domain-containing protein n=1 Tax=Luteimonas abyssi TaxID=1247514 RepID=UPI000737D423|nr:DUF2894 domain-containing protein [Luteimonas abyssi]